MVGAVLVVGAGIGGIKCALELAESGFQVYLCDRSPAIGGTLTQLDKWFPDNHCEMCKILPTFSRDECSQFCLRRGLFHPNIKIFPLSTLEKLEGEAGDFLATISVKPRGVNEDLCIGCDLCSQVCPVEVDSEFNEGLEKRKAIYLRHPLAMPNSYAIDWDNCTKCGDCVEKCPTNAIDLSQQEEIEAIEVGAIVLATGFEEFRPQTLAQYGHRRYPNVLTSIELERILSPNGPTGGKLLRPSDSASPKSIAFLQCIGSRDRERDYCSAACCMYALKEAMLVKEANPDIDVHIFFMDLRAFGKGYYRYYEKAKEDFGIKFTRCRVPQIKQDYRSKNLLLIAKAEDGLEQKEFDLVVLSVGQTPSPHFLELAEILGIEVNKWGFCETGKFFPVATTREGIYVCGSVSSPKDIADTLVEAGAASCQASVLLSSQRNQQISAKIYPEELDVSEEEARVAIFLCHCGEEIASVVNMEQIVEFVNRLPGVVHAQDLPYLCLKDTLEQIKGRIKDEKANRVVIAACSTFPYKGRFIEAIRDVGLNPSLLELVDLREQLSWVHPDRQEAAMEKVKSLLAMALEKVKAQKPLPVPSQEIERQALVIGGGLAGLVAALSLAEQGVEAHLVERGAEFGGHLRHIYATLDGGDPQALLKELVEKIAGNPLIHLYKETEVIEASGYAGNFEATLKDKDDTLSPIKVGAIVIATGAQEYEPTEYLYGQSEKVVTQQELERRLTSGELDPGGLGSVVMIQCVGSRDKERPYCSRVCCSQALKNAINLKEKNPEIEIVILYRDMMSYGFQEEYYTKARENGVIFVNYETERKPEVEISGEALEVQVFEPVLGGNLIIKPDLLVLSAAIVPHDNTKLAEMLDLELDEDGFFQEAEVKFRPVDFLTDGIFLCGLAHSPRNIAETIAQAQAAAMRAASLLTRERLVSGRIVAEVDARRCSGCELCISVCPFNARVKDEERRVVVVRETLCQGCGACVVVCPNSAAKLRGFIERQVLSIVDAAV